MPKFVLDRGDKGTECSALPGIARGYIEAMFWTSASDAADECYGLTFADLAETELAEIVADCAAFYEANKADCEASGLDDEYIGHDLWLTRNGHGTGFWDRGLGDVGNRLADAARKLGNVDAYKGDDGKLYLM